ncbi:MAG TPA: hypothetical protein VFP50_10705, partial [Anaeromyxobacteraceae bacterium]|nr:hypothetical protein [Anaeromyxobacteraceae bacterium]
MRALAAALLVAAAPLAAAEEACPLASAPGGLAALLGAWPRPGTPEAVADLAVVLWEQRTRTDAEVARAVSEEALS